MTGPTHRANRNWELWDEDEGLLSPTVAVLAVAVLGGGMVVPVLPGLLLRRVACRPVSTCCRAACACCRSNCSCIWSCWSWEAEGPEEFIWPPAARRTPDSWDNNSAGDTDDTLCQLFVNVYLFNNTNESPRCNIFTIFFHLSINFFTYFNPYHIKPKPLWILLTSQEY